MDVTDPVIDLLEDLRPQPYAIVRTDRIVNPIVEPQWGGVRVLAAVEDGSVACVTKRRTVHRTPRGRPRAGRRGPCPVGDPRRVPHQAADGRDRLHRAAHRRAIGERVHRQAVHRIRRDRVQETKDYDAHLAEEAAFRDDDRVAFVAIDLLRLDGDSLLDVPLLERKRLLDRS